MRLIASGALLSTLFLVVWGCDPGGGSSGGAGGEGGTGGSGGSSHVERVVGKVVLSPESATIREGATVQLEAQVFDAEDELFTDVALSWSSDDEDVAAVDESGLVTAFIEGSAVIAVRAGAKAASATIEVTPAPVSKVKIVLASDTKLEGEAAVLAADSKTTVRAIAYDEDGEALTRKFKWTSDDEAVAKVSSSGVVQGVAPGRTWITASTSGKAAKVEVAVVHRFQSISVGGSHSCALSAGDRAWCWGSNMGGRLGNDSESEATFSRPVAVAGDHRFGSLSAGTNHSCALDLEGQPWCWGLGFERSLGGPTANEVLRQPRKVEIAAAPFFLQISVGGASSCAITDDGRLFCWGQVNGGQQPTRLWGNLGLVFVSVSVAKSGDFFCAMDSDKGTWCWGQNDLEQIASPSSGNVSPPKRRTGGFDGFMEVSAGVDHGCGGVLYGPDYRTICWGAGDKGQTGSPSYPASSVNIVLDVQASRLSAGAGFSCGIVNERAFCWGTNANGQLGKDPVSTPKSWDPLPIASIPAHSVAAGVLHACALSEEEEARVFCWGNQTLGLLGNGVDKDEVSDFVWVDGQEVEP